MVNAARAVGPALAGVLIVSVGVGACFLFNAVSFVAVIIALATMRPELLHPAVRSVHAPGQLLEGFRSLCATDPAVVYSAADDGADWRAVL